MVLASWAYGLERGTRPVLSSESCLDIRGKQICLNLKGTIARFKLIDHVNEVLSGECYVRQRDARYCLFGSVNNVFESLLSRDVVKFNSDSICITTLQN